LDEIAATVTEFDMTVRDKDSVKFVFTPEDATYQTVEYSSSNPAVATAADGLVKAVGAGEAVITATSVQPGNVIVRTEFSVRVKAVVIPIKIAATFGNGLTLLWESGGAAAEAQTISAELFYTDNNGQQTSTSILVNTSQSNSIFNFGSGPLSYIATCRFDDDVYYSSDLAVFPGPVTDYTTIVTEAVTLVKPGDFDIGGTNIGFFDTNAAHEPGSAGANYRPSRGDTWSAAVDIEADAGNIGYTNANEWLAYTVDVRVEGDYEIDWYVSVNGSGAAARIEADGQLSTTYSMVNNANWTDWRYYCERNGLTPPKYHLTVGKHRIRYIFAGGVHNYNGLRLTRK
jgi:hypothetical protein